MPSHPSTATFKRTWKVIANDSCHLDHIDIVGLIAGIDSIEYIDDGYNVRNTAVGEVGTIRATGYPGY